MEDPQTRAQFEQEAEAFITRHWLTAADLEVRAKAAYAPSSNLTRAWYRALAEQGWGVPHWPVAWGGLDWSASQLLTWRAMCARAGAPPLDNLGTALIGPMLIDLGLAKNHADWMRDIAQLAAQWTLAHPADTQLTVQQDAAGRWRLHGSIARCAMPWHTDWLLCRAQLTEAGKEAGSSRLIAAPIGLANSRPQASRSGWLDMHWTALEFDQVAIQPAQILAVNEADQLRVWGNLLKWQTDQPDAVFWYPQPQAAAAGLRYQLDGLEAYCAKLPYPPAALLREVAEIAIAVEGLAMSEHRLAQQLSLGITATTRTMTEWVRVRGLQVRQQIGDLQTASFGYYALPQDSPPAGSNEPQIGADNLVNGLDIATAMQVALHNQVCGVALELDDLAQQLLSPEDDAAGERATQH